MANNKITWNANQLQKLEAAVMKYNSAVRGMLDLGYQFTPNLTTVEKEKSRISNRWQLRTRINQLERATKMGAADRVEFEGESIPRYLRDEIRYTKRMVNNQRRKFRERILGVDIDNNRVDYTGLDDVTYEYYEEAQRNLDALLANKNLADIEYGGFTGDDLDDLLDLVFPDDRKLIDLYVGLLEDNFNTADVIDIESILERMSQEHPDILRMIFESNLEEVSIGYIYPELAISDDPTRRRTFTAGGKTFEYKKSSANQQNYGDRQFNIINLWHNVANQYLGEDYSVEDTNFIDLTSLKPKQYSRKRKN